MHKQFDSGVFQVEEWTLFFLHLIFSIRSASTTFIGTRTFAHRYHWLHQVNYLPLCVKSLQDPSKINVNTSSWFDYFSTTTWSMFNYDFDLWKMTTFESMFAFSIKILIFIIFAFKSMEFSLKEEWNAKKEQSALRIGFKIWRQLLRYMQMCIVHYDLVS